MKRKTTNYAKGRTKEYKTIELFEHVGFKCVRAAGSHGPFDIIAMTEKIEFLVQVKSNEKPSAIEIDEMRAWPAADGRVKCYCVWKDYEKYPIFYFENEW